MNRFGNKLQQSNPQPTTYPMQDQLLYLYPSLNASLFQNITPLKYIPVSQYTGNPNFSDDEGNFHRDFLNIE